MPSRIQRKRTKGWRMPENTIYVGRPTKWGNPYNVGKVGHQGKIFERTSEEAVRLFSISLGTSTGQFGVSINDAIRELKGKNLACWCPLDKPCHADVLLRIAND